MTDQNAPSIKKGDLVMVVRPRLCCPQFTRLGGVFTVSNLNAKRFLRCRHCGKLADVPHVELAELGAWMETVRLKKIDPPARPVMQEEYTAIPA